LPCSWRSAGRSCDSTAKCAQANGLANRNSQSVARLWASFGLGRIGQSVVVRAAGFGLRILAFEPLPDMDFVREYRVELVSLNALLARSDFVTLHAPLCDDTRGMINRKMLGHMKHGSVLINTARSGLVVEKDLLEALESGHLAGAGLDVFETEPAIGNPLLELPNVIASPHLAGIDTQSVAEMAKHAAQNILDLRRGV